MAPTRLPITCQVGYLPKRGHSVTEYEDAFACCALGRRFAVADGASESSFAAQWARLLVAGFVDPALRPGSRVDWLRLLQQRWAMAVDGLALPWYAEVKREEGAYATFLGLQLRRVARRRGEWRCLAVGDSCLFQIREGELIAAFPVQHPEDFNNQPHLIGSRPAALVQFARQRRHRWGDWQVGDRFWLMTDALAHWFLKKNAQGEKPWQEMEPFFSSSSIIFTDWAEHLRDCQELRNDDVTLMGLRIDAE